MAASEIILTNGATPATPAAGKVKVFANSSKRLAQVDDTGAVMPFIGGGATYAATPADPTGTANTTGLMAGLAGSITPATSGRLLIMASGNLTNSTATAGDGCKTQLSYGTGSAPANAAALTGTQVGNVVSGVLERNTAGDLQGFCCMALVTGLTVGTAYWLDLTEAAIVGGTGQVKNISLIAVEV